MQAWVHGLGCQRAATCGKKKWQGQQEMTVKVQHVGNAFISEASRGPTDTNCLFLFIFNYSTALGRPFCNEPSCLHSHTGGWTHSRPQPEQLSSLPNVQGKETSSNHRHRLTIKTQRCVTNYVGGGRVGGNGPSTTRTQGKYITPLLRCPINYWKLCACVCMCVGEWRTDRGRDRQACIWLWQPKFHRSVTLKSVYHNI